MSSNDTQTPEATPERKKGPLSFLSGSLTSLLMGWLSLGLSKGMVTYFANRPPTFSSPTAQSIASALKTLLIGMCFLATFSFVFIGIGLFLVFLRSLFTGKEADVA
ncbi:hypothetical protein WB44_05090 [Synechococcus sp. WH 8020]|uniref:DUF3082 domain-containing protein n=1 Tax=unclassified Synechococcus TaxID=2626047 RepID=UPI00065285C4|nr:DUF3082 domain-containing protein [Synechococcus sp. WH 8020]AKN60590.1 hypothetical protein WB44_05090 [Synechococcus sp. WH 8020]|tara:strand:- start:84 stop:401 length:318 start_codon:yes stop_codon:yes gene_type:complete